MTNEAAWNVTPHSDTRMNRMTIIPNTGSVLAALDKTKHGLFICTATGSGLTKDHVYLCNADGDALIDLSTLTAHTHTVTSGGRLLDILIGNPETIDLWLTKTNDMQKANWIDGFTSTGSVADHTDSNSLRDIRLLTGATSGSSATVRYPYLLNLNFAFNSICTYTTQFETADSLAFHGGINADDITAADSNIIKYQAEVCTVTNSNWWLRTANGSANSASDTGTAINASRGSIKMIHLPTAGTPEVSISVNAGTTFQKTTHIPITGSSTTNNLLKFSQKNNTAADRPCRVYGARLSYVTSGSWGYST